MIQASLKISCSNETKKNAGFSSRNFSDFQHLHPGVIYKTKEKNKIFLLFSSASKIFAITINHSF